MQYSEGTMGRVFTLRLENGEKVPDVIEQFAHEHDIKCGLCTLIGGVDKGNLVVGPKDGEAPVIDPILHAVNGAHEVAGLGTLFPDEDGTPILHMHAALGRDGKTRAGCIRPRPGRLAGGRGNHRGNPGHGHAPQDRSQERPEAARQGITMYSADVVICGAGIIGLTIARRLLASGVKDIIIFDKEERPGVHASGRNSGVLHAGIYYDPGTLKAKMCLDGNLRMQAYCEKRGLPLFKSGKVIVARDESELPTLDELKRRAEANGATVEMLDMQQLSEIEPNAMTAGRALYSPPDLGGRSRQNHGGHARGTGDLGQGKVLL